MNPQDVGFVSAHDQPAWDHGRAMNARFLTLTDVAETLNISSAQTYALVRSGELRAIKIGGRGQWRVEASELESYIAKAYEQTADFVSNHPFGQADSAFSNELASHNQRPPTE